MIINVTTGAICIESTKGRIASFPIGSMIVRKVSNTVINIDSIYTNDLYKEDIINMNLAMIKNTAVVAPGITDDSASNYIVGDVWYDSVGDIYYEATSVAVGAAVWASVTDLDAVVKDYTRKLVDHMCGVAGIF